MALLTVNTQEESQQVADNTAVLEDYVFDTPVDLVSGAWQLHIEKGDAWIFCNDRNFCLKSGETVDLDHTDGPIQIRRLYIRSTVKFKAVQIA